MNEINSITLTIRNDVLRQKFAEVELEAVKRRWEIVTIVYTVLIILYSALNWNDLDSLVVIYSNVSDCYIVFCLFSLLGRYCQKVHNYSLLVLIIARAAWLMFQLQMVLKNDDYVLQLFNYRDATNQALMRVMIATSMLFLTQFNLYLFFIMPFTVVMSFILTSYTNQLYS